MYELAHRPSRSFSEKLAFLLGLDNVDEEEDFGVFHGDDNVFLFQDGFLRNSVATSDDLEVREAMATFWTNFAKHGDPTPYRDGKTERWPLFDVRNSRRL